MKSFNRMAFGMIELLVSVTFLAITLLPLINLFSTSIDGLNVIQARSQATLLARELVNQASTAGYQNLSPGIYTFSENKSDRPEFASDWVLCDLPANFSRSLIIKPEETETVRQKRLQVSIFHEKLAQANLSWYSTVYPDSK